jgi:hypothetical protein
MQAHPTVRGIEAEIVRRAFWLLPVTFGLLLPAAKAFGWPLILLHPLPIATGARTLALLALAGAIIGVALVWFWRLGLARGGPKLGSWRLSIVLGMLLVLLLEWIARQPAAVHAVWAALAARAVRPEDYALRQAAMFRQATAPCRTEDGRPRLLVVGTSQLLNNVDYARLQRLLPDMEVKKFSMPGMYPTRMLMTGPRLRARTNDTIAVYWSEFDMCGVSKIDAGWYRPVANAKGMGQVVSQFPLGVFRAQWREVLDVGLASVSELWRDRDAFRLLMHRLGGGRVDAVSPPKAHVEPGTVGVGPYPAGLTNDAVFNRGLESACHLLKTWKDIGARVVVLEGSVSPSIHRAETAPRRLQARNMLEQLCRELGFTYFSEQEQSYVPGPADWRAAPYLKTECRAPFTDAVADAVRGVAPRSGSTRVSQEEVGVGRF